MDTAGKLNQDWIDDCRSNAQGGELTLEDWICQAGGYNEAEISDDGTLWVVAAGHGQWASQSTVDELVAKIERGI